MEHARKLPIRIDFVRTARSDKYPATAFRLARRRFEILAVTANIREHSHAFAPSPNIESSLESAAP